MSLLRVGRPFLRLTSLGRDHTAMFAVFSPFWGAALPKTGNLFLRPKPGRVQEAASLSLHGNPLSMLSAVSSLP